MQPTKTIFSKESSNDFIIRVANDNEAGIKGKIENVKTGQVQYFNDYLEMLMLIQDKLDQQGSPQCDTELRSFADRS